MGQLGNIYNVYIFTFFNRPQTKRNLKVSWG